MTAASPALEQQPRLVFFHSALSGHCRRVEGFLAQVLQRRRNHGTFEFVSVAEEERPDLLERFRIQTLPTLIVVGEDDKATPVSSARTMHEAIPGSRLVIIPEAGHVSNLEQPERFNAALRDFLQALR